MAYKKLAIINQKTVLTQGVLDHMQDGIATADANAEEAVRIANEASGKAASASDSAVAAAETAIAAANRAEDVLKSVPLDYQEIAQDVAANNKATAALNQAVKGDTFPAQCAELAGAVCAVHNSAARPMQGLVLYGKTTQEGVPTVKAPVKLVNVESMAVRVQGKNMVNLAEAVRIHATATVEVDGDSLHTTVTADYAYSGAKLPALRLLAGVTYTLSARVSTVSGSPTIGFRKAKGASIIKRVSGKSGRLAVTYTPEADVIAVPFLMATQGTAMTGDATFTEVQLEIGSRTAYERHVGEVLTIADAGGLAGILVPHGGNFITDTGAQYVADYIDLAAGKRVQMIGKIASYDGEDVGDVWQSSTGELSTGASVVYALDNPITTALDADMVEALALLNMRQPVTTITTDSEAELRVRYITTGSAQDGGHYVAPVAQAWEQRMLDRIDQCFIPMTALRNIPKAATGYTYKGQPMPGINYSSVYDAEHGSGLVGVQIPLRTYYSALENPASILYTQDAYQDDTGRSSPYGITCSGFVSYIIGASSFLYTEKMAQMVADGTWSMLTVEDENDLFQIKRGDIVLNTVVSSGNGDHVKIVRDVVHDARTGRLLGFNMAEAWKPFCRVVFLDLAGFLAQMREEQPYRVIRLDDVRREDGAYSLAVQPVKYSRSVYPDKGDGGAYAAGETVWLYMPGASKAKTLTITAADGAASTANLADLETAYINGVQVYALPGLIAGTHTIAADAAPDDPCTVDIT